jgi:flagellar basal body-associated protein FliL
MLFLLLVTLISVLLTVIMSVIAWRTAQDEKRRSEARIAALAADIHQIERLRAVARREPDLELRPAIDVPMASPGLFQNAAPGRGGPRFGAVAGIGVLVFVAAAAVIVTLGSGSSATPVASAAASHPVVVNAESQPAAASTPAHDDVVPVELLALGHDRDGDKLTVRGVVRNPSAGRAVDRMTAVVFLYNRDGGFLTSGRAAIESSALLPGGESAFVVVIPGANDVGRYRVSFRTDDRVVPHVDRRDRGQERD